MPTDWLRGLTILDLSSLLPCPFASHLLAKFGARVIKIESPNRPDPARQFGFIPPNQPDSSCYRAINSNKELVWLDLKSPKDREKLYELVKTSHGAIEGYRPEVRKRLGIEYPALAALNHKFVLCSVVGYDPKGAFRDRAGHDINFVARSGILDQTRDSSGQCVMPGLPVGDYVVSLAAALRFACALRGAEASGRGSHVEFSIEEALNEVQLPFLSEAIESGEPARAGETLVTGKYPCYRLYEIDGGTFALGALESKFWEVFCRTIGRPELIPEQFHTGADGLKTGQRVLEALRERPYPEWLGIFSQVDCCIEPVLSIREVIDGLQS